MVGPRRVLSALTHSVTLRSFGSKDPHNLRSTTFVTRTARISCALKGESGSGSEHSSESLRPRPFSSAHFDTSLAFVTQALAFAT